MAFKILISGSSGLVGSGLVNSWSKLGFEVTRLVRSAPREGAREIFWDPVAARIDSSLLEGFDAVVHLAGENLANGRWTPARKARIRGSRVKGTQLLCAALGNLERPPATLIAASAVGFYGDRADERLTEESAPGTGFLAEVCRDWEAATKPAEADGIRVVHVRFGMVLSDQGGALAKMLPPFRWGLGGVVGKGSQYWSWIALDDLVAALTHILERENLAGPVNVTSPQPETAREFTKILAQVLSRPAVLSVPAFAVRMIFGQMADETLLASARVEPAKLLHSGYVFCFPDLRGALCRILKTTG